jgi:hypothetical protein
MTDASLTTNESTGSAVFPPMGSAAASPREVHAGDGGAGGIRQPSGPSSRLVELKRGRSDLREQLSRLGAARAELDEPSRVLEEIEAEKQAIEAGTAAELALWAQQGCEGQRPTANPERMAALARQKQATEHAIDANATRTLRQFSS